MAPKWRQCCHNRSLRSIDLYLPSRDQMIIIKQTSSCTSTTTACWGWLGDPIGGFSHSLITTFSPLILTHTQPVNLLLIDLHYCHPSRWWPQRVFEIFIINEQKRDPDMELQFKIYPLSAKTGIWIRSRRKLSVHHSNMSMDADLGEMIISKCTLRDPDLWEEHNLQE